MNSSHRHHRRDTYRRLPSRFQIGEIVTISGMGRTITGVTFYIDKIWYQADDKWWPSEEVESPRASQEPAQDDSRGIVCTRCKGTGCLDTPFSGSDPSCTDCSGEGVLHE